MPHVDRRKVAPGRPASKTARRSSATGGCSFRAGPLIRFFLSVRSDITRGPAPAGLGGGGKFAKRLPLVAGAARAITMLRYRPESAGVAHREVNSLGWQVKPSVPEENAPLEGEYAVRNPVHGAAYVDHERGGV